MLGKSKLQVALESITKVMKSDWTGDLYITPSSALDDLHSGIPGVVFYGETEHLYNAIYNMVEKWPCSDDPEAGCQVFTKPVDEQETR